ncbi:MDR/zinc-dependent alcohol dehydrogenase-like family protein [Pseudothermotoga elfii]
MKALFYDGNLRLIQIDKPRMRKGFALVKILMAGICNTDLEILKGYMNFSGILGHEFVGIVEKGPSALIGKRVVGEINIPCKKCDLCLEGLWRHCRNMRVLGINGYNGVFAQYALIPVENLHVLPHEIADEEAVFVEPLGAAFRITEQINFTGHEKIAVLGDGKLGLVISKALNFSNIAHVLFGKHEEKLSLAKNWTDVEFADNIEKYDRHFDVVIDATGKQSGLQQALYAVKPEGTIVLKTTVAGKISIDMSTATVNEVTIVGSRCGPFPKAIFALQNGLRVVDLIEDVFDFDDYQKAFEKASGALKVILKIQD